MPTIEEVSALIIKKYKAWEADCEKFIKEAVKIEDRDTKEFVIPFEMWELQTKVLDAFLNERLSVVLKARQLGLTWLALAYAIWQMIFRQGYSVVALSKREEPDAKELVRRLNFILRNLPEWLIREKKKAPPNWNGPVWEGSVLSITIHHPGGEPSTFQSLTASQDSGRSFTANLVILDEWAFQMYAKEIWDAAYPTINRPTGGQVIGLSTNKRGTLFEHICREALRGANPFKLIFLPWYADPRRDREWYERTKKALPESHLQEYPETIEDAFSAGEGTAFPEFSRDIHVCEPFPIPSWAYRWRANDPGYTDPFFWVWFAVLEDGKVYVYREYTRSRSDERVPYSKQARMAVKKSHLVEDGQKAPEDIAFTVTGRDAYNKHPETGKAIIDYYFEGGVKGCIQPPKDRSTDRIQRKAVIHEYFAPYFDENERKTTAKVQIFSNCQNLIEALPMLVVDDHDPEKVAASEYDHAYDAFGMGLQAWHATRGKRPKKNNQSIIRQHKDSKARGTRKRRLL